jgi:hypothetical protein
MQISLRSQLIAGTAAVVGASAIAMTPVMQANLALPALHVPSAAQAVLTGFDSPLTELLGTVNALNQWLVSPFTTDAAYIALGGLTDSTGVGIAQTTFKFQSVGLLPQVIADHMPILTQVAVNTAASLENTLNAATTIGIIASEAVWNLPGAVLTATQQALSGDISGAIATLQAAILTPITTAGQVALDASNYMLQNAVARGTALLSTLPSLFNLVVQSTVGQAQVLANSFITVAQNVIAGLTSLNAQTTWNAVVDGFLGPKGIPGTILNLTVGAGVQTGATTVVPSIRGEIQATVQGVKVALSQTPGTPVPPPASAVPSPSASALRAAAVQGSSTTNGGGSGNSNSGTHAKGASANAGTNHASSKRGDK